MMNWIQPLDRTGDQIVTCLRAGCFVLLVGLLTVHSQGTDWSLQIGIGNGQTLRPLLGVNAGPYPVGDLGNVDLTSEYQDFGVTLVRTHDFYGPLDMAEMYPDHSANPNLPNSYDFTDSDVRFKAILDAGLVPYFRLGDSYNNPSPPNPADVPNYVQASVNVIRHYREGYWNGFNSGFPYVEIWNEPGGGTHFWPGQSQSQFNTFYIAMAEGLRAQFPDLKIGGPGWAPSGAMAPGGQADVASFLDAVNAVSAPLDFLSWHIYTNDPQDYAHAANFYRNELDTRGLTATESHISEWNTSTSAGNMLDTRVKAQGAAINTAAWIALQNSDVAISTFYRGNDTSISLPTFFGMFRANGIPKKTALAFDLWSDMVTYSDQRELAITNGTNGDLASLVGEDAVGNIAVLISNLSEEATHYEMSFDLATELDISQYTAHLFEVSDYLPDIGLSLANPQDIPIAGHTVHLVTLLIPEPSTLAILVFVTLGLLPRRQLIGKPRRHHKNS